MVLGLWGIGLLVSPVMAMSEGEIVSEINNYRASQGVSPVVVSSKLTKSAGIRLADIQKYKYWSHNNPVTGESWLRMALRSGVRGKLAENLARGYSGSSFVVGSWVASATHRNNLINPRFTRVGVMIGEVNYKEGVKQVVVSVYGE